jgi:hypothetical protein
MWYNIYYREKFCNPEIEDILKFSDDSIAHGLWMLENQIHSPFDLISLWTLFPQKIPSPTIEQLSRKPWYTGLEKLMLL